VSPPTDPPRPVPADADPQDDVEEATRGFFQFLQRSGPPDSPVEQAVGRELKGSHLTKMLELAQKAQENRHAERMERLRIQPRTALISVGVTLTFLLLFTIAVLYYQRPEPIAQVLTFLAGLGGGFGGGYVYGKGRANKPEPPPI
jgi:hypothetical protein